MIVGVLTQDQLGQLEALARRLDAHGLADEAQALRAVAASVRRSEREVPASVAAAILHVTPQTVRNWVRNGVLAGRQDPTGHFLVAVDSLEPTLALGLAHPVVPDELANVSDDEINAEIEAVRAARRARATAR
jgi:hypothetical protein